MFFYVNDISYKSNWVCSEQIKIQNVYQFMSTFRPETQ